ncbi:MAG: MgtC/SapB family protein [Thermoanaerobaculia bacterium]
MESLFQILDYNLFFRLFFALILGGLIGLERQVMGKPAGLRTHILISLGSSIFTILSLFISQKYSIADPTRIPAMILSGIGFIGAGAIIQARGHIQGLTTAASIWATASVGMACGFGALTIALLSTLFILFVLHGLSFVETKISVIKSLTLTFPDAEKLYEFLKKLEEERIILHHSSVKFEKEKGFIMDIEGTIPLSLIKILKKDEK